MNAEVLSDAVVVWTGWGVTSWPARDEQLVVEKFGTDLALDLLPLIRQLEADFNSSDAIHTIANLTELGDAAADQFRTDHPDISDAAVKALRWCYTFDNR